ncbi:MAG: cytochrome c biogenesis protein CcsA, partial [Chromatiales bacterium]|nr:cytochrome c biogenesis protein CcsA [Chromatiales bacterium]
GWWFWDPVENASFMPWLVGTGLIHSLAVTEKRSAFKRWTVLLAISAFSLSLLGTFLVRSGVLTSVHAFATDPERGVFILAFLGIVIGGSLLLYAWRAPSVLSGGNFDLVSRETFLLANNVLLTIVAVTVLLGTLYPLLLDALGMGKISVGHPYFNSVFIPLMIPVVFLMGVGPLVRWKQQKIGELVRQLWLWLIAAAVIGVIFALPQVTDSSPWIGLAVGLAAWVVFSTLASLRNLFRNRSGMAALKSQGRSYYGMLLAHLGIAISAIGITVVSQNGIERDVSLAPEQTETLSGYEFTFKGVQQVPGPNYVANRGHVTVHKDGKLVADLHTEKRTYRVQQNPMTEAAIDPGFLRDIYVSLGEPLGGGSWSLRLYYKPFVRWIWLGTIFMALGGILAISDRRYRVPARSRVGAMAGLAAEGKV